MGWSASVVSSEHTGGEDGNRHLITLVFDATTSPGTDDMPIRDRLLCEYPEDPSWWQGGRDSSRPATSSITGHDLLPDRITDSWLEVRYADRRGRTQIEAWANRVKTDLALYGTRSLRPRTPMEVDLAEVDWTDAGAHRACRPMLAALGTEGSEPPECSALQMCASEAILDHAESVKLYDLIEAMPGCQPP
jgi:hypothetical protein